MFLHPLAVTAFMVFGAVAPAGADTSSTTAVQEPSSACEVTQAKYARYTKTVYREREKISDRARDRIERLRQCAKSEEAERNMVELRRKEARDREERQRQEDTPYRFAFASWYGPGLYGNPLGCGGVLTTGTMGIAHKTLPCGTRVDVCARDCASVSVVDRGPYVGGREVDLTAATAQAIGFGGVGTIRLRVR